jgi:hypothetical protein
LLVSGVNIAVLMSITVWAIESVDVDFNNLSGDSGLKECHMMTGRLTILITSYIPGLAMADGATETVKEVAGAVVDFVIPPAYASVPEPSILPLLAIGSVAVLAVKFMQRNQ